MDTEVVADSNYSMSSTVICAELMHPVVCVCVHFTNLSDERQNSFFGSFTRYTKSSRLVYVLESFMLWLACARMTLRRTPKVCSGWQSICLVFNVKHCIFMFIGWEYSPSARPPPNPLFLASTLSIFVSSSLTLQASTFIAWVKGKCLAETMFVVVPIWAKLSITCKHKQPVPSR